MARTLAPAITTARADTNLVWPHRLTASDGTWGNKRHQKIKSDHNDGNAIDITHDPATGPTGQLIALYAMTDPRVIKVIWNCAAYEPRLPDARWRDFQGDSAHTKHCHISIDAAHRDDTSHWGWNTAQSHRKPGRGDISPLPPADPPSKPLQLHDKGDTVLAVQHRLRARDWKLEATGTFDAHTAAVIREFQLHRRLRVTGKLDEKTWDVLWAAVFS